MEERTLFATFRSLISINQTNLIKVSNISRVIRLASFLKMTYLKIDYQRYVIFIKILVSNFVLLKGKKFYLRKIKMKTI